jgi:hypothetical protein
MPRTLIMFITLCLLARAAHGQDPATSFADLPIRLVAGEALIVTNSSGEIVKGRLVQASGTGLVLRGRAGNLQLAASDVQRIERPRDTLWNGVLIGAAVGFGAGALLAAIDDCSGPGIGPCFSDTEGVFYVGGVMGLMGSGIGAAVDAMVRRERVVFVGAQSGSTRATITPLLSWGRAGLQMQMWW